MRLTVWGYRKIGVRQEEGAAEAFLQESKLESSSLIHTVWRPGRVED